MSKVEVRLSGTNLERAANHNMRITLHAIRVHQAITRVALARITGLTAPAVANITRRLIEDGLIVEDGRIRNGRGQPGKVLKINPAARYSFGVNIDRGHVSLILVNFAGDVLARRHWEKAFALPEEVKTFWERNAPAMMAEAGADPDRLTGIGAALPDDLGSIYLPGAGEDYSLWQETDAAGLFLSPFNKPVFIENDAAAAAMGEQQFGVGPQLDSFLYILISSGLGGGLVIDGRYVRGAEGRSGEIGLIPIQGGGLVQDHVSLSGLSRCLAGKDFSLADLDTLKPGSTCDEVFKSWLDGAVERLVPPLIAANCLINPAGVLIGGRLAPACIDRLTVALNNALGEVRPALPACAPVSRAQLSEDAPSIGAAILPFSHFHLPHASALWKDELAC